MTAIELSTGAPRKAARARGRIRPETLLSLGLLILILAAWWTSTAFFGIPEFVLPKPRSVIVWLIEGFSTPPTNPASTTTISANVIATLPRSFATKRSEHRAWASSPGSVERTAGMGPLRYRAAAMTGQFATYVTFVAC